MTTQTLQNYAIHCGHDHFNDYNIIHVYVKGSSANLKPTF